MNSATTTLTSALEQLVAQTVRAVLAEQRTETAAAEERSPWMSTQTAAEYLDWPPQRLYKLTASGAIPHYKHEGRLMFRRDELDTWLLAFRESGGATG